jgi:anti-sigma B factor antagonist
MTAVPLDIRPSADSGRTHRWRLRGELDAETSPRLVNTLRGLCEGPTPLCLDLSEVTFIDCSGLTALLGTLRELRRHGCEVVVDRQVSRPVRRIIQMTDAARLVWP